MKSNEVVQEGPLDFAAKVGAGIGGMVSPTGSFAGGYQSKAAEQKLTDHAKRTFPAWNQAVVNLKQQGVQDPDLPRQMQAWLSKAFELQMPAYPAPALDDKTTMEYLKKAWAMRWTQQQPQQAAQQQPAQQAQAAQGQQPAQQAAQGQQPAQSQQPAAQPQANPAHAIFQDPAKFTAEFNKYIQSTGLNQLVNFKLKDVLKDMWMRSGGTRVESKNNKGKRV